MERLCTGLGEMLLWYESSAALAALRMTVWGSRKNWQMDSAFLVRGQDLFRRGRPVIPNLKCAGQLDRHKFETLRVELVSKN